MLELSDMSSGDEGYDRVSAQMQKSSDELEKCFLELRGTSLSYIGDRFYRDVQTDKREEEPLYKCQEKIGYDGDEKYHDGEKYPSGWIGARLHCESWTMSHADAPMNVMGVGLG